MTTKHMKSKQAIALRVAAKEFWAQPVDDPRVLFTDPHDRAGHARWNALSRAAVAYAKLVLAGQCIPQLNEHKHEFIAWGPKGPDGPRWCECGAVQKALGKWHTCSHGPPLPPGARCSLCE